MQTNIVRHNGNRGRAADCSQERRRFDAGHCERRQGSILPRIHSTLPSALNFKLLFDQSIFVRAAISGCASKEAIAAALLTGADDSAVSGELAQHP